MRCHEGFFSGALMLVQKDCETCKSFCLFIDNLDADLYINTFQQDNDVGLC